MSFDYVFNETPDKGAPSSPALALDESTGQLYYSSRTTGGWAPTKTTLAPSEESLVFNVRDYGAVGNGTTDDYAAVQLAIDAACAPGAVHAVVYFPKGTYLCRKPLRVYGSNVALTGESRGTSLVMREGAFSGPSVAFAAPVGDTNSMYPRIPTAAALVGSGVCFSGSGGLGIEGFEFREVGTSTDMDGRSAFCVEFWFKADASTTNATIMSCSGMFDPATSHTMLTYGITSGNLLFASIDIGGVTKTLTASISLSTTYHTAFTYDGTTLRLFLNGSLASSTAATGTVVQKFHENWQIGYGSMGQWPWAGAFTFPMKGQIDSIRVSSVARYTSPFVTPTSKLTFDANTLVLQNWDAIFDMFSPATSPSGTCYMVYHRPTGGAERGAGLANVEINDLGFSSTVFVTNVTQFRATSVFVENAVWGMWLDNNCYNSAIRDLKVLGSVYTMACLILGPANGLMELGSLQLASGKMQLVGIASSATITDPWFELNANTYACCMFAGPGTYVMSGGGLSFEDGSSSKLFRNIVLSSLNAFIAHGIRIEDDRVPIFTIFGGQSITLDSLSLAKAASTMPASIISIPTPTAQPVLVLNCSQTGFTCPWSDNSQSVSMPRDGYKVSSVSGAVTLDANWGSKFFLTLVGDMTSLTINNAVPGQALSFFILQDSSGGHAWPWPPTFLKAGAVSQTANDFTSQRFVYDGTNYYREL